MVELRVEIEMWKINIDLHTDFFSRKKNEM